MRSVVRPLIVAFMVCVVASVLSACDPFETDRVVTINQELDQKLQGLVDDRAQSVLLSSLTDFAWDEFGFIPEGTSASEIEAVFGDPLISDESYTASPNLFVFLKNGEVVTAPMIILDRFDPDQALTRYDNNVRLGFVATSANQDRMYFTE